MSMVDNLQRAHLKELVPYASARRSMSGGSVWLNANEAPYTAAQPQAQLNRYPEFQSTGLNQSYANYAGVELEQVLSCRGSDEAIDLLIRTFCEPQQDHIIICPPTYGMYAISAQTHGAETREVPLQADTWQLDIDEICRQLDGCKLIFVCSPSNPLGNDLDREQLEQLLKRVGEQAFVVVDEAYIEFSQQRSVVDLLSQYPQLIILRTLSKAFGLAAIRCGFALAQAEVIECLRKVIAPYPLAQPVIDYAQQALQPEAIAAMQDLVTETQQLRQQLADELGRADWVEQVYPSVTNFILLKVANAAQLVDQCAQQGVLIRNQSSQRGLSNCVRISIGSAEELNQLREVLPL